MEMEYEIPLINIFQISHETIKWCSTNFGPHEYKILRTIRDKISVIDRIDAENAAAVKIYRFCDWYAKKKIIAKFYNDINFLIEIIGDIVRFQDGTLLTFVCELPLSISQLSALQNHGHNYQMLKSYAEFWSDAKRYW